jgi:hypothetical protein
LRRNPASIISLIERWSKPSMHGWVRRAQMYDRHEARVLNEEMLVGKAAMRKRLAVQAQNLQHLAYQRVQQMTPKEIAELSPAQFVALFKVGAEYEMKAREIPQEEIEAGERDNVPTIHVHFIPTRPAGYTAVRLGTGQGGYIPDGRVDEFRAKYPDAVIIR